MPMIPQAGPASGGPADALLSLLGGPGGGAGPPGNGGQPQGADPLEAVQQVVQDLHTLISVLPDPGHTQVASQCLAALTKVQRDLMSAQQGAGQANQTMMRQFGG